MLEQWDLNHDGKINRDELTMLLLQQSKVAAEMDEAVANTTEPEQL